MVINPLRTPPTPLNPQTAPGFGSNLPETDIARQQVDLAMSEHMTQLATNLVNKALETDRQLLNILA
jgi:hypothetical protein